jgi:hypothetical protein
MKHTAPAPNLRLVVGCRHDDQSKKGVEPAQLLDAFEAVIARHLEIEQNSIRLDRLHQV